MKTKYEIEDLEWIVIHKEGRYAIASFLLKEDAEEFLQRYYNNNYYEIVKIDASWSILS